MDSWEQIIRLTADRRLGATALTGKVITALGGIQDRRGVLRAARRLLKTHGAMAPIWHACAAALDGPSALAVLAIQIAGEAEAVARVAAGWAMPKRARIVTHSASQVVLATIVRAGPRRVEQVVCGASLPGGEGRTFAARLRREGFDVLLVHDAQMTMEILRPAGVPTILLVGVDALTQDGVVNKVGTTACMLAAREAGVACYALAGPSKLIDAGALRLERHRTYESTALSLIDAVVSDAGPMRTAALRKAAAAATVPAALARFG